MPHSPGAANKVSREKTNNPRRLIIVANERSEQEGTQSLMGFLFSQWPIDHFTVSCLVAWPLNESEAGGDLVLIETSLLFSC